MTREKANKTTTSKNKKQTKTDGAAPRDERVRLSLDPLYLHAKLN
jgi:hypothetical protein